MAFVQLHWHSTILGKQTTTWVLVPDVGTGPFATFYLLHGLSDDHTTWVRQTRLESHVGKRPLIVVMPDGGRGFYTNHHDGGPQWATHIGVELPGQIERLFPALPTREGRFIGGLSMGGYGALRVALGHPRPVRLGQQPQRGRAGAPAAGRLPAHAGVPGHRRAAQRAGRDGQRPGRAGRAGQGRGGVAAAAGRLRDGRPS